MDVLNRLRIGPRLGWGFGTVLLLLCAMAAVALMQLAELGGISRHYASNLVPSFESEHKISMALGAMRRFESQHIMVDTAAEMDDMERRIAEQHQLLAQALDHYEKTLLSNEQDRADVAAMRAAVAAYYAVWEQIRPLSRRSAEDPSAQEQAQKLLFGPSRDAYARADEVLQQWWSHNSKLADDQEVKAEASERQARWMLLGFGALALLLGGASALLITRSITQPMAGAVQTAEAVAEGDLTSRVDSSGHDEAARLLQALGRMNQRLSDLVRQVRSGSDSIATGSQQIAAGSTDLSQRTEKQAASLQETAASMEQLNATVKHNADTAQQASQMATAASDVARKGGQAVDEVVSTMQEISASSRKIEDIIGVIDGIAFQTNILALNAAVEAARAGEQGRGFAVVASEVRSLAQRSAAASKEIKTLIGDSVQKVQAGAGLVDAAGHAMVEVVSSVRKVSDLIAEIAAASQEQSAGIEQVNTAITQMDQVVQQNASLVEEASAATESMKEQAGALLRSVSRFRLAAAAPAAYAPRAVAAAPAQPAPQWKPAPIKFKPALKAAPAYKGALPTPPGVSAAANGEWK
jgi:methyl-accepting chemotaxis protein